jgi:hypothetical protein
MPCLKDGGHGAVRSLQADAFGGEDGIDAGQAGGRVVEVACWAHSRRQFHEARRRDDARCAQALAYIRLVQDVEDQAQEPLRAQEQCEKARSVASMRLELRQKLTRPRPGRFKAWLESQQAQSGGPVLPKRPVGQAIGYGLNPWAALCVYGTDGELGIDNNISERALRRIAVGRNNRMFCGSAHGGNTAVTLLGLMATCERHGVNLFDDLRDVVGRIAARPISGLEGWLAQNGKAIHVAAQS